MMMILKPALADQDQKKRLSIVEKIIGSRGQLDKSENLGKKELAYHIKKESQGTYWLLLLTLDPQIINELNAKLKMEDDILRFLILKKKPLKKAVVPEVKEKKVSKTKKVIKKRS